MPAGAVSPLGLHRLRPPGWVWARREGCAPAVIYWGGAGRKTSISRSGAQHEPGSQQRGVLPAPSPDTLPAPRTGGSRGAPAAPGVNLS